MARRPSIISACSARSRRAPCTPARPASMAPIARSTPLLSNAFGTPVSLPLGVRGSRLMRRRIRSANCSRAAAMASCSSASRSGSTASTPASSPCLAISTTLATTGARASFSASTSTVSRMLCAIRSRVDSWCFSTCPTRRVSAGIAVVRVLPTSGCRSRIEGSPLRENCANRLYSGSSTPRNGWAAIRNVRCFSAAVPDMSRSSMPAGPMPSFTTASRASSTRML